MPKQKRYMIKQHIDVIQAGLGRYRDTLVDIANLYKEHHPDYFEMFMEVALHFDNDIKMVEKVKETV